MISKQIDFAEFDKLKFPDETESQAHLQYFPYDKDNMIFLKSKATFFCFLDSGSFGLILLHSESFVFIYWITSLSARSLYWFPTLSSKIFFTKSSEFASLFCGEIFQWKNESFCSSFYQCIESKSLNAIEITECHRHHWNLEKIQIACKLSLFTRKCSWPVNYGFNSHATKLSFRTNQP